MESANFVSQHLRRPDGSEVDNDSVFHPGDKIISRVTASNKTIWADDPDPDEPGTAKGDLYAEIAVPREHITAVDITVDPGEQKTVDIEWVIPREWESRASTDGQFMTAEIVETESGKTFPDTVTLALEEDDVVDESEFIFEDYNVVSESPSSVKVTATVSNNVVTGSGEHLSYWVDVSIDGSIWENIAVGLDPGETEEISVTLENINPGDHEVCMEKTEPEK